MINSENDDGAAIPSGGWLYEDGDGEWQNDKTLTVESILIKFNDNTPYLFNN